MNACYKESMPNFKEPEEPKNVVDLAIKVSLELKAELQRIGKKEDRKLGYLARAFILRGIAAYERDGLVKEPQPNSTTESIVADVVSGYKRSSKQSKQRA